MKIKKQKLAIKITLPVAFGLLISGSLFFLHKENSSSAADARLFNAGNIMSDYVMTNKNSMSETQIQTFLNSKVSCDHWGVKKSELGEGTRAQYAQNRGWPLPFECLNTYKQDGETAAHIIWQAAQDYNINPQVLIVLLQKEQSLVTDEWPGPHQYRAATGYGCPDTAACDSQYYGFKNQVRNAAKFFNAYQTGNTAWYKLVWPDNNYTGVWRQFTYNIKWHPDNSCGASPVWIENRATASLYSYTPYRPNAAALNAGYGLSSEYCSSYGNRNFYLYFTDWFGATTNGFVKLDTPRWMQIKVNTYKRHVYTEESFGPELLAGRQIYFPDKVMIGGKWFLRTEYDQQQGNSDGIPLEDLEEIPIYKINPVWMSLTSNTKKINPATKETFESVDNTIHAHLRFTDKITVDGQDYYRTEYERDSGRSRFITDSVLSEVKLSNFITPRYLIAKKDIEKIDARTGNRVSTVTAGSMLFYNQRINLGPILYAQAENDKGTYNVVNIDDLSELGGHNFISLITPRWISLKKDARKVHVFTGESFGPVLLAGQKIYFPTKILINGEWYLRTDYDTTLGNFDAIPLSDIE
ncbi:hypothetical protein FWF93_02485 [Candidatus Saccharibacteria bacterium]|nr:hypothetical protein [Candidatus Saccharibacteria bacterium]